MSPTTLTKRILILDSSQIDDFLTCPTYWKYKDKEHLIPIGADYRAMNMGTLGHHLLENYFKARAKGSTIFDAKNLALALQSDELGLKIISKLAIAREDVQSVVTTVENWITLSCINEFVPLSPDHVEVGFSEKLYEDDSTLFVLEGKIDLIGTYRNSPCIVDHKFHLRVTQNYNRSIQFRNYAMVTGYNSLNVNHLVFANGDGKTTNKNFYIDPITFSSAEHRCWRKELIGIYCDIQDQLNRYSAMSSWKRRSSCGGKYGRPCEYTTLCNDYDADTRAKNRETLYRIKEEWRPW
jgi:PD-(D/E)XK nuclease superfamily